MTIDCGYGARLKSPIWKENAYTTLLSQFGPNMKSVFDSYYNESKAEGYDETQEEYMQFFCEEYENADYGWTGMLGVIADLINENEFGGNPVFRAAFVDFDDTIYVSADIPENEAERERMLTKQRIREIIAKYIGPILESGVDFDYVDVHEND